MWIERDPGGDSTGVADVILDAESPTCGDDRNRVVATRVDRAPPKPDRQSVGVNVGFPYSVDAAAALELVTPIVEMTCRIASIAG
jgi:hypothetical protein